MHLNLIYLQEDMSYCEKQLYRDYNEQNVQTTVEEIIFNMKKLLQWKIKLCNKRVTHKFQESSRILSSSKKVNCYITPLTVVVLTLL